MFAKTRENMEAYIIFLNPVSSIIVKPIFVDFVYFVFALFFGGGGLCVFCVDLRNSINKNRY